MYAKLVDGILRIAPKNLPGDGTNVYNPPAEMYAIAGYKPVRFTEPPEAPEGYHYEGSWDDAEDEIIQIWHLVEDPDEVDEYEAYSIIFGGGE